MANLIRFIAGRATRAVADFAVTNPLIRWSWTGPSSEDYLAGLGEFRPTDRETILEMMQGRYLLASKLVDTNGVSPFAIEMAHDDWVDDLQAFAWLRHFRDARNDEERRFARTLTLDWIGREGRFNRESWALSLCARRVLNWLRHYNILVEGASSEQAAMIGRSLGTQIQSLKLRGALAPDPEDALMAALALCGVALCDERRDGEVTQRVRAVHRLLESQIDDDGLHRSRSAKVQVQIMVEVLTIRQALRRNHERLASELSGIIESMHVALDAISLGTGEPGYFNGTGQMPHDIMVAVQAQSPARARSTGTAGGYGRLISGNSIVVADSGAVPEPEFTRHMHAGALAFEFSYGRDLIVGNCGPVPAGMEEDGALFRQGIAHSAPTINAQSAASIPVRGPLAGRVVQVGRRPEIVADLAEDSIAMRCFAYEDRFGAVIERHLTLLGDGKSLVGQDRIIRTKGKVSGVCAIRFHLGQGTDVRAGEDLLRLHLASGQIWNFLWEGADARIEDSVRQSTLFGFHRTRQLVLEVAVAEAGEISWIFTLDEK